MTRSPLRRAGFRLTAIASLGVAVVALPVAAGAATSSAAVAARPAATAAKLAVLPRMVTSPPGPCGVGTTVSYDLYAKAGTMSLPGLTGTVPIFGYTATAGAALTAPGGPTLVACSGQTVQITLYNGLAEATSLLVSGLPGVPDRTGIPAAGVPKTYSIVVGAAGTYLYGAGLTTNAEHQSAMGLYGALVVRPASAVGQAYPAATTTFDDEAIVLVSELDPALNGSTTPATFDMRTFSPKYSLINGQPYPGTSTIPTSAGKRLLLRYLNAGTQPHSMAVLGLNQTLVATDGSPYADARHVVAETFGPGQTADVIAAIPATATAGTTKYALYDAGLSLNNNATTGLGGALTFIAVGANTAAGPTSVVTAITTSTLPVTITGFTGTITSATPGAAITSARYFVDSTSGLGTAVGSLAANATSPATVSEPLTSPITTPGVHTIYLQGVDANGTGALAQLSFTIPVATATDTQAPTTSALALSPNPSNGTVPVTLTAQASDIGTGSSDIASATVTVTGYTGPALTVAVTKSGLGTANLLATIPAGLASGPHTVTLTSRDTAGNTSAAVSATLTVDTVGPVTAGVIAAPNPTNGKIGLNSGVPAVRVTATVTDAASVVGGAEGFIDTVGALGAGFLFSPVDGQFDNLTEAVYADIPLATVATLSNGPHTILVRGKDALGNWTTATATGALTVDKLVPTFTGITLSPTSVLLSAPTVALTLTGADGTGSDVVGGEWWTGSTNIMAGTGTPFTGTNPGLAIGSLAPGTYTVRVRIIDAAGNWSTVVRTATLTAALDAIFANGFETGTRPWGWTSASTNTTSRLDVSSGAALAGTRGLQAQGNNTNYVQYNYGTGASPAWPTFDARFSFVPNGNTSSGTDIFVAAGTSYNTANTALRVRYRLNVGQPQVQIQVGTANANATWTNLVGGTTVNTIEVVWQAGTTLQLYVNGALAQTLTASNVSVQTFRLGSVTNTGNNTLMYFDAFSAKRSTTPLFGP